MDQVPAFGNAFLFRQKDEERDQWGRMTKIDIVAGS